jgi:regulatory protein YycI of two-component signal transduction system YycFG
MEVNKIISFLLNIILLNVFLVGQRVHAKDQQKQDISLDKNAYEQQLKNNKKSHDAHSIQGAVILNADHNIIHLR